MIWSQNSTEPYEPSPAEIQRECAAIQRHWTEKDRRKRAGEVDNRWRPPMVDTRELESPVNEAGPY